MELKSDVQNECEFENRDLGNCEPPFFFDTYLQVNKVHVTAEIETIGTYLYNKRNSSEKQPRSPAVSSIENHVSVEDPELGSQNVGCTIVPETDTAYPIMEVKQENSSSFAEDLNKLNEEMEKLIQLNQGISFLV